MRNAGSIIASNNETLFIGAGAVKGFAPRSQEDNARLRGYLRSRVNGARAHGELASPQPDSPLVQEFARGQYEEFCQNARVYYDPALGEAAAKDVMSCKAGTPVVGGLNKDNANLVTFTLPTMLHKWVDGRDMHRPVPAVMLNFTYQKFNDSSGEYWTRPGCSGDLTKDAKENLEKMIKLNLLAVAKEGERQGKPVPFILNYPGAYIRDLSPESEAVVKREIATAFAKVLENKEVQGAIAGHVSDFIVIGGRGICGDRNNSNLMEQSAGSASKPIHFVNAEMVDIAKRIWEVNKVACPLPMMGEPLGAIGNGGVGNRAESAVDEFFARACGGVHCLVGNGRYNRYLDRNFVALGDAQPRRVAAAAAQVPAFVGPLGIGRAKRTLTELSHARDVKFQDDARGGDGNIVLVFGNADEAAKFAESCRQDGYKRGELEVHMGRQRYEVFCGKNRMVPDFDGIKRDAEHISFGQAQQQAPLLARAGGSPLAAPAAVAFVPVRRDQQQTSLQQQRMRFSDDDVQTDRVLVPGIRHQQQQDQQQHQRQLPAVVRTQPVAPGRAPQQPQAVQFQAQQKAKAGCCSVM